MGNVSRFLKENRAEQKNLFHPVTKDFIGEDGMPLLWEIRHIGSDENERIREECTTEVPEQIGKYKNQKAFRPKVDQAQYVRKLICRSVVEPNLYDAALQDSYGVKTPEELITELIRSPGEYAEFAAFIQEINGFNELVAEKVDFVKNGSAGAKTAQK